MRILTVMLTCLMILSCTKKEELPPNLLSENKMQAVFWDFLRVDAFSSEFLKRDSSRSDTLGNMALQQYIFKHHKVTRKDFYDTYHYYAGKPEKMVALIDSMVARQRKSVQTGIKEFN